MRILRKCEVCGEEFIATKITNKYCSKRCARVVHRKKEAEKKKKARESMKDDAQNLQSLEIASRPFLTPSDVAFLLGVSVTTVYRCFYAGTLKAVRLRRKTYVRREDLDKYFEEAGAYKKKSYKRKDDQEYYTLREIMEKYNIGRKAVWGRCDRLGIPKVYVGRNTFFSKKAVDAKFADLLEEINHTVQHLLNHKNVSTTQIYASHTNPKTREAAGRITLTNVKDDEKPTESTIHPKANKRK